MNPAMAATTQGHEVALIVDGWISAATHSFRADVMSVQASDTAADFMIQSRLRELMATKSRRDQRRITYSDIPSDTGISTTTTRLARDRSEKVALTTIDRLCAYFEAQPGDLFIYVDETQQS